MCQCHKLYCQTIFHQSAPDKKKISRYQFLQIKVLLRENKISGSRDGWSTNGLVDQARPRCNCFCIFPAVIEFSLRCCNQNSPGPSTEDKMYLAFATKKAVPQKYCHQGSQSTFPLVALGWGLLELRHLRRQQKLFTEIHNSNLQRNLYLQRCLV